MHLHSILDALGPWAYVALAVLVMLEGPACTLLGTAGAVGGLLSAGWVFVAAAIGNLCGDLLWYTLGRVAPVEWLVRHGRRLGLRAAALPSLRREIADNSRAIIVTAKLTWVFATTALMALGMARVPIGRWLPADAGAELIWSGLLVFGGYGVVHQLARMGPWMGVIGGVAWVVAVAGAVVYLRGHGPSWAQEPAG